MLSMLRAKLQYEYQVAVFKQDNQPYFYGTQAAKALMDVCEEKNPASMSDAKEGFERIIEDEATISVKTFQPLRQLQTGELWKSDIKMTNALAKKLIKAFDIKPAEILTNFFAEMLTSMMQLKLDNQLDDLISPLGPESSFRKIVEVTRLPLSEESLILSQRYLEERQALLRKNKS